MNWSSKWQIINPRSKRSNLRCSCYFLSETRVFLQLETCCIPLSQSEEQMYGRNGFRAPRCLVLAVSEDCHSLLEARVAATSHQSPRLLGAAAAAGCLRRRARYAARFVALVLATRCRWHAKRRWDRTSAGATCLRNRFPCAQSLYSNCVSVIYSKGTHISTPMTRFSDCSDLLTFFLFFSESCAPTRR